MKLIFSTKGMPTLAPYSVQEKQQILALAQQKFTVPEKLILNLIKLALLIPPFIYLARQDWLTLALALFGSALAYVLVMRPASLHFCNNHLDSAITSFKARN